MARRAVLIDDGRDVVAEGGWRGGERQEKN